MTGHVMVAMTEHDSHVGLHEKHAAVGKVLTTIASQLAIASQVEGWVEGRPDGTETAG